MMVECDTSSWANCSRVMWQDNKTRPTTLERRNNKKYISFRLFDSCSVVTVFFSNVYVPHTIGIIHNNTFIIAPISYKVRLKYILIYCKNQLNSIPAVTQKRNVQNFQLDFPHLGSYHLLLLISERRWTLTELPIRPTSLVALIIWLLKLKSEYFTICINAWTVFLSN